ncbi:MAG TPA: ketoacyl-ACP synthase III [Ktedonobacteraceae bacterium]|nr:ketoacyl-ACP synthase III [Ktedonobacteraceae bacterium]
MIQIQEEWPEYLYIDPQVYTKARARLCGLGYYVPAGVITNEFYSYVTKHLGEPRSVEDMDRAAGLSVRHVRASTLELCRKVAGKDAPGLIDSPKAPRNESLIDMAVIAAQRALASAGRAPAEVDAVIGISSSDEYGFPTVANLVQLRLGLRSIRALMLKGACSSQTEAFQIASEMLTAGSARLVLIVATEGLLPNVMHILDWKLSSLFGEGAAAFLLESGDEETYSINGYDAHLAPSLHGQTALRKDVIEMAEVNMRIAQLYAEGKGAEIAQIFDGSLVGYAKMNGKEVFRIAPRTMAECIDALCRHAQLSPDDVSYIVPHQANSRITRRLGEILVHTYGWPPSTMEKLVDELRYYGNLSNVSIAIALAEMLRKGRLHDGQWLALAAVGAGIHYGAWLVPYHQFKNVDAVINFE